MMKKILLSTPCLVLAIAVIVLLSVNTVSSTRPFSVPCVFKAEVIDFKETTTPVNNIEQYKLTLEVLSYEAPPPQDYYNYIDTNTLKTMCSLPEKATVVGTWHPSQNANKNKILTKGAVIKGNIDSFDKILTNVSLVKEAANNNNSVNINAGNIIFYLLAFFLILVIVAIFLFRKYGH